MAKYLKVYTEFADCLEPLSDAEIGRLFLAMLHYAEDGITPDFKGNERFIWPSAKQKIDVQAEIYQRKIETAEKNRSQRSSNINVKSSNIRNSDSNINMISAQDKDKDKDKDKKKVSPPPPIGGRDAALEKFKAHRKAMKKPMTADAVALTIRELEKLAPGDEETQIAIIEQSIQRGWQGVFPLKTEPKQKTGTFGKDSRWGTEADSQGFDDLEAAERMVKIK